MIEQESKAAAPSNEKESDLFWQIHHFRAHRCKPDEEKGQDSKRVGEISLLQQVRRSRKGRGRGDLANGLFLVHGPNPAR